MHPPTEFLVEVDGIPMSGLVTEAAQCRGVVVALHGGASDPVYWDSPGHPRHSLMRVGAALGFTVVAPHRPGYGASRKALGENVSAPTQVDLTYGVVQAVLAERESGAGVFLVGHSQGCVLAVRMAADTRGRELLGIELSGTGIRRHPEVVAALDRDDAGARPRLSLRERLWEPSEFYPGSEPWHTAAPAYDGLDARGWPDEFCCTAATLAPSVRIVLADHEGWWAPGSEALAELAALFTGSERVVAKEQFAAAHNISLGHAAMAYHLELLAFVEECISARSRVERHHRITEVHDA